MNQGCCLITVEIPLPWLDNPADGERNSYFCFSLVRGLCKSGLPLRLIAIPVGADFMARRPKPGEVIFSYHSVGSTPNVFRLKEAPIRPLYSIDSSGYAGWSDIVNFPRYHERVERVDLSDARAALKRFKVEFCQSRVSKYPQSEKPPTALPEQFVFLPLQVQNDSVACLSPFTGLELLSAAAAEAKTLRFHLVVKRHPQCRSFAVESTLQMLAQDNEFVTVSASNIHDLLEQSHSVITVNSGVGMEALIHGKTVYCTGRSEWAAAATTLTSLDQVGRAFEHEQPRMDKFQEKLVAFLLTEYWVDPNDQARLERRLKECLASFDPDYGEGAFEIDELHALNAELLGLHAELDHQTKIAKLAMIDFEQAKKEALALRRDARYVRAVRGAVRKVFAPFKQVFKAS